MGYIAEGPPVFITLHYWKATVLSLLPKPFANSRMDGKTSHRMC